MRSCNTLEMDGASRGQQETGNTDDCRRPGKFHQNFRGGWIYPIRLDTHDGCIGERSWVSSSSTQSQWHPADCAGAEADACDSGVLRANANLENEIQAIAEQKTEVIRIAAYSSIAMSWMSEILYRFRRLCPKANVDLRIHQPSGSWVWARIFAKRKQTAFKR